MEATQLTQEIAETQAHLDAVRATLSRHGDPQTYWPYTVIAAKLERLRRDLAALSHPPSA